MPHVIMRGRFFLTNWLEQFEPVFEETDDWLIKFSELYLEKKGNQAIVPVVTIEEGYPQSYYVKVSSRGEGTRMSIRLDPSTDPIKTRGVKRSIALVAESTEKAFPDAVIESHNLQGFYKVESSV